VVPITPQNIEKKAEILVDQYKKKAVLFKTGDHVFVPFGNQLTYHNNINHSILLLFGFFRFSLSLHALIFIFFSLNHSFSFYCLLFYSLSLSFSGDDFRYYNMEYMNRMLSNFEPLFEHINNNLAKYKVLPLSLNFFHLFIIE
jgi:hypothetical protein